MALQFALRIERATRKNCQLAPAQRVAMKMGRRLRGASVTSRTILITAGVKQIGMSVEMVRDAPSYHQSGSDRLAGGPRKGF
jgi:hypothetical protein